eukprot:GFUD01029475.1.p1 GENE.GFUD01029475.1~~GFUD01029475.1.p1  ORF type:complete len:338 (+),score=102.02 GFUD01029475.1:115-1128(+)
MASLTSNPMEDTENMEDEYMEENSGHRRSRSNPGPEQTRPQPPRSLDFPSATSSISLTTPSSPGVVLGKNTKLENIKNWTISTYKCSRQSLYEKMGKTSKTVDPELEDQIETLRNTQKKYSDILRLARALTSHFFNLVQTQVRFKERCGPTCPGGSIYHTEATTRSLLFKNSLGECFSDLAHKSPELQQEFLYNAEAQRNLTKNGQHLLASLNFFVSSVNTIANKTMEDSLLTVKQYETARVEYDAYRTDLEFYAAAKETEANQMKLSETQVSFNNKKAEFEKLRSDVQIKLKFLDENRVKVMSKQLLLFHTAVSAYYISQATRWLWRSLSSSLLAR